MRLIQSQRQFSRKKDRSPFFHTRSIVACFRALLRCSTDFLRFPFKHAQESDCNQTRFYLELGMKRVFQTSLLDMLLSNAWCQKSYDFAAGVQCLKRGVGTPFPPHYTPDLGWSRTLTPNIAQMLSHTKSSFSSSNPFRQAVIYSATSWKLQD